MSQPGVKTTKVSKHFKCLSIYHRASKWNSHPRVFIFHTPIYIFNLWEFYLHPKLTVCLDQNDFSFSHCKDQRNSPEPLFSMWWVTSQGISNVWLHNLNLKLSWLLWQEKGHLADCTLAFLSHLGNDTHHFYPKFIGQN